MEYESMGKLIRTLRKEKGLTQKQLADMLDITDKAVSKWERDIACPDTITLPRLADILGVTVESLLNIKIASFAETEEVAINDFNPTWKEHKEHSRHLIRQGIPGFVVGSVGMLVVFIIYFIGSFPSITGGDIWEIIIGAPLLMVELGLIFAGVSYGWKWITRQTEQWTFYGNIFALLILFFLKLIGSIIFGVIAYPVVVVYNLIRSQKSKKRVHVGLVLFCLAIFAYVIFAITMATMGSTICLFV